MVIKGGSRGGPQSLAAHLSRTDTNERVEVRETRGVIADNLLGALREMDAVAAGTRCQKPLYHASMNTRADEHMTDEQWDAAIDRLEAKLGLTGQPRVVVEHGKKGREHVHVVWSRIDLEHMRTISDSHNYRRHEEVARELEREFGHERVQGAHIEREGQARPERTPSHAEMQQAARSGLTPDQARDLITGLWQRTDSGQTFATALGEAGWILARGDRRDFLAVDPSGGTHSLSRRIEGATAADVRARMADIDRAQLPSVADARATQRELAREAFIEQQLAARAMTPLESRIQHLQGEAVSPGAFQASLYREGITLARVDAAGLEGIERDRRAAFQNDKTFYAPSVHEGELVAVNPFGGVHRLNPQKLDLEGIEQALTTGNRSIPGLGAAREFIERDRADAQLSHEQRNADFWKEYAERRDAATAARVEAWEKRADADRSAGDTIGGVGEGATRGLMVASDVIGKPAMKLSDFAASAFESLFGGSAPVPRRISADEYLDNPEARAEAHAQRRAVRASDEAIDRIRHDVEAGKTLRPDDVRLLTPEHLLNLKARGDDYMREIIGNLEREQARSGDRERER